MTELGLAAIGVLITELRKAPKVRAAFTTLALFGFLASALVWLGAPLVFGQDFTTQVRQVALGAAVLAAVLSTLLIGTLVQQAPVSGDQLRGIQSRA